MMSCNPASVSLLQHSLHTHTHAPLPHTGGDTCSALCSVLSSHQSVADIQQIEEEEQGESLRLQLLNERKPFNGGTGSRPPPPPPP